MIVRK